MFPETDSLILDVDLHVGTVWKTVTFYFSRPVAGCIAVDLKHPGSAFTVTFGFDFLLFSEP